MVVGNTEYGKRIEKVFDCCVKFPLAVTESFTSIDPPTARRTSYPSVVIPVWSLASTCIVSFTSTRGLIENWTTGVELMEPSC